MNPSRDAGPKADKLAIQLATAVAVLRHGGESQPLPKCLPLLEQHILTATAAGSAQMPSPLERGKEARNGVAMMQQNLRMHRREVGRFQRGKLVDEPIPRLVISLVGNFNHVRRPG